MTNFFLGFDFIGIIMLMIMYFNISNFAFDRFTDQKLFRLLLLSVFLFFVSDVGMYLLEGTTFKYSHLIYYFDSIIYYLMCGVQGFFWLSYSYYKVIGKKSLLKKNLFYFSIPLILNTILTLLSPFFHCYFYIDNSNAYHRGDLIAVAWLLFFVYYIICSMIVVTKANRENGRLSKELYQYFLFVPVFPIVGGIFQILYGGSAIGASLFLAFFLLFIKMQNEVELERIVEYEQLIIEATHGLYENIYELDVTHDRAADQMTEEYFESLGIPGTTPCTEALVHIANVQIREEHRQGYLDHFLPQNVLKAFDSGLDTLRYDFLISKNGGDYYWIRITARIFYWKYDRSVRMLTYRQNIHEEKMRELEPLKKVQELEEQLVQNKISIMLSQIQPHFLYNALVVIKQLCDEDPQMAKEAVMEFSNYLRGNMDAITRKTLVTFDNEMRHVKNYLSLEKKRFGEKIKVVYNIKTTGFMLPALTIQPLVENAVRYGITKKDEGGTVTIETKDEGDFFVIEISDNGVGFNPQAKQYDGRSHIGVDNVRNRLQAMSNGDLQIDSEPGKGTRITVRIPKNG